MNLTKRRAFVLKLINPLRTIRLLGAYFGKIQLFCVEFIAFSIYLIKNFTNCFFNKSYIMVHMCTIGPQGKNFFEIAELWFLKLCCSQELKTHFQVKTNPNFVGTRYNQTILYCILYYSPESQESDGVAIHREAITPTYFQRYRDIAVQLFF